MAQPVEPKARKNNHASREGWMRHVAELSQPIFKEFGYTLPDNMRFNIGFPSTGRKGKMTGEWLSPDATGGMHEIIVRNAIDDPYEIIVVMFNQFGHAIAGPARNKAYRDLLLSIGMDVSTGLRSAKPKAALQKRLNAIVEQVGPIPHTAVDYDKIRVKGASTLPAKQRGRQLKAECVFAESDTRCGYVVRVAAGPARDVGPPHCPLHGAMFVHWPDGEEPEDPFTIDGTAEEVPDVLQLEAAE